MNTSKSKLIINIDSIIRYMSELFGQDSSVLFPQGISIVRTYINERVVYRDFLSLLVAYMSS